MFKPFAVAAVLTLAAGAALATDLSGAGATFPKDVYAKWAEAYAAQGGGKLNYQAIGSGAGVKQITNKTVDFGASDKPLTPDALTSTGLYQFPTVIGGVVPVFNVGGFAPGELRLTGPVLADIYMGKITKWNDPAIARLNATKRMPAFPITVVHRSDGSGTSFLYTTYLSMVSPAWKSKVGGNDAVNWPVGIGGKGNDGVAATVKQTAGAIGYVEYAYARQNHLNYAQMYNASGVWVQPTAANFAAAAAGAPWAKAPGNYVLLLNQPGKASWPITGATFVLVYKKQADATKGAAVLKFFDWAYTNGDAAAERLDFVTLPPALKALIRKQWATMVVGPDGRPVYVAK